MHAIQFDTVVVGDTIRIPDKYRKKIRQGAKVTVLADVSDTPIDKTKAGALSLDDFTEMKLDTRGFKFDREEANT
jgi:hypothetical protein